jgi:hypothetical protein
MDVQRVGPVPAGHVESRQAVASKPGSGFRPYAIQVSPKGDVAVVGNQGGNTGDIDTINVIDLEGKAPRIIHTLDVGQIVEGLVLQRRKLCRPHRAGRLGPGARPSLLQ